MHINLQDNSAVAANVLRIYLRLTYSLSHIQLNFELYGTLVFDYGHVTAPYKLSFYYYYLYYYNGGVVVVLLEGGVTLW